MATPEKSRRVIFVRETILPLVDTKNAFLGPFLRKLSPSACIQVENRKNLYNFLTLRDTSFVQETFFVRNQLFYHIPRGHLAPTHRNKISLSENPLSRPCSICQILIHPDLGKKLARH